MILDLLKASEWAKSAGICGFAFLPASKFSCLGGLFNSYKADESVHQAGSNDSMIVP